MTIREYQELAQVTSNKQLTTDQHILNGVMGLSGESGECIDIVKKYLFQGHIPDTKHLAEELGDVLWYCAELASGLGVSLEDIAEANIEKLKKRYPEGFEAARSINREV